MQSNLDRGDDAAAPPAQPARSLQPRSSRGGRKLVAILAVGLTVVASVLVIVREPWHGPILLTVSTTHGVDTGDLVVLPLVVLAVVTVQRELRQGRHRRGEPAATGRALRSSAPVAAIVFGVLLLAVGVSLLARGTALQPAGGGTFDGGVTSIGGRKGVQVRQWSHVAVSYDGTSLRMFVNGEEVAREDVTGSIQATSNPLWIGGNQPYGEHFKGLIDELRVYNRALDRSEIVADMSTPIQASAGESDESPSTELTTDPSLVAAYGFEAGTGTKVEDSSGYGNDGAIDGASWSTSGRFGGSLDFTGDDVVRVPESPSLDLGSAMTMSAWVRPSVSQGGWRTIVQKETDAYFLHASSDLDAPVSMLNEVVATAVAAAGVWFCAGAFGDGGWWDRRRWSWHGAAIAFLVGCFLDALFTPSATVFGPMLLAAWFAVTARRRGEAMIGWTVVGACAALTVASLADLGDAAVWMVRDDGGNLRSATLGGLLVACGLVGIRSRRVTDRQSVEVLTG